MQRFVRHALLVCALAVMGGCNVVANSAGPISERIGAITLDPSHEGLPRAASVFRFRRASVGTERAQVWLEAR